MFFDDSRTPKRANRIRYAKDDGSSRQAASAYATGKYGWVGPYCPRRLDRSTCKRIDARTKEEQIATKTP